MSEGVVKEQLQAIYDAEGDLTPTLVLDQARSEGSPLHKYFEWNDSVAAEKHRLGQAQRLITTVKVVYRDTTGESKKVRQWHAVPTLPKDWGYKPLEEIATDDIGSKILLADMRRDFESFKKRYEDVAGYLDLIRSALQADVA